jgi:hypothetical protein
MVTLSNRFVWIKFVLGGLLVCFHIRRVREVSYKMMFKTQKNVPKKYFVFFPLPTDSIVEPLSPPHVMKR